MLKIGLTGNIGSGKTTVAQIFSTLSIPILYADDIAKMLMQHNQKIKELLIKEFGEETYNNGILNRPHLSNIVFKDSKRLEILNSIVHPAVFEYTENWFNENQEHKYAIKEAAILIESGAYKAMDYNILVIANDELRIERVMKRDSSTYQEVMNRMANQMKQEEKIPFADYIIYNENNLSLIEQVMKIHFAIINKIQE